MRDRNGKIWISAGLLLIAAALFLSIYNIWEDQRVRINSESVFHQVREQIDEGEKADGFFPAVYAMNPEMEMPVLSISDEDYIGILEIPALNLELPVLSQWSDSALQQAPCRYSGSVYSRDMVIAGHNYGSHFGHLKNLTVGDSVRFTDGAGRGFLYEVESLEILEGSETETMKSGDWDLTLFTCTFSGRERLTLRCVLSDNVVK